MSKTVVRCCGISFRDSPTTIVQSLLVKLPLVYCLALVELAAWPYRRLLGQSGRTTLLRSLLESQFSQIREAAVAPRLRCVLASRFYHLSPRLSGFIFRTFNFLLLSAVWCAAASVTVLMAKLL